MILSLEFCLTHKCSRFLLLTLDETLLYAIKQLKESICQTDGPFQTADTDKDDTIRKSVRSCNSGVPVLFVTKREMANLIFAFLHGVWVLIKGLPAILAATQMPYYQGASRELDRRSFHLMSWFVFVCEVQPQMMFMPHSFHMFLLLLTRLESRIVGDVCLVLLHQSLKGV